MNGIVEASGTASRQNGEERNGIGLTERLTDIFVEENDGHLLIQQSDREDRILLWLQALDMQVIGAWRTNERLKPLLKISVSNGFAEDRLLAHLSQHFEPSEVEVPAFDKSFKNETKMLSEIQHKNIVKLHGLSPQSLHVSNLQIHDPRELIFCLHRRCGSRGDGLEQE
ncbi:hypothetical protein F3Y22_tig00111877pilonHSYRG00009 [Hibiscus syriacus]|uniref:Protein kinase domain-containing protein n=1 Tax=Hibiscus syriacus TaxID=106335 RepID=A0A6A2XXV9_HIBSY|nr:hypothetical protein F3Y22_tig00111877pilonHSYRG00009 [Hibiscus syriacus]